MEALRTPMRNISTDENKSALSDRKRPRNILLTTHNDPTIPNHHPKPSSSSSTPLPPTPMQRAKDDAWKLRRDADETRLRLTADIQRLRAELTREKQRTEELELQRDFQHTSEAKLREQLAAMRAAAAAADEEKLREAQEAQARLDELREEMLEEASEERSAAQRTARELEDELAAERAEVRRLAALVAKASTTREVDEVTDAKEENARLSRELTGARRRLADLEADEADGVPGRGRDAEVRALKEELHTAQRRASEMEREATQAQAALGDLETLRRQLEAADRHAGDIKLLEERLAAATAELAQWHSLVAAELPSWQASGGSTAKSGGGAEEESLATRACAAVVKQRELLATAEGEIESLRRAARDLKAQANSSTRTSDVERANAAAAAERAAAAETAHRLSERSRGALEAEVEGLRRLVATLEEDREQTRRERTANGGIDGARAEAVDATVRQLADEREARSAKRVSDLEESLRTLTATCETARAAQQVAERAAADATAVCSADKMQLRYAEAERERLVERLRAAEEGGAPRGSKVLHLAENPTTSALSATVVGLRARISSLTMQLEAANEKLGVAGGGGSATARGPTKEAAAETAAASLELQAELEAARRQLTSLETQNSRLATVFRDKIEEFRKAVLALTGYRVDLPETHRYNVFFAASGQQRSDALRFRANSKGDMELLESDCAARLLEVPHIRAVLQERGIPAFLCMSMMQYLDAPVS